MRIYIFTLFFSFIISQLIIPFVRKLAIKYKVLDIPDRVKIHPVPVPKLGGIALYISFVFTTITGFFLNPVFVRKYYSDLTVIFIFSTLILILGIISDIKNLSALKKIIFEIVIITLFVYFLNSKIVIIKNPFFTLKLSYVSSFILTALWIFVVINSLNLVDGLDGLACGISFIVCVGMFIVALQFSKIILAFIYLGLAGSILGFNRYNGYPAKIFLGDSGIMFVGFMVATLSILAEAKSATIASMMIPLIMLGIPVYDALLTVYRRSKLRRSIIESDTEHLHHRILKSGYSPKETVYFLYGLSILLAVLAFLIVHIKNQELSLIIALLSAAIIVFFDRTITRRNEDTSKFDITSDKQDN